MNNRGTQLSKGRQWEGMEGEKSKDSFPRTGKEGTRLASVGLFHSQGR